MAKAVNNPFSKFTEHTTLTATIKALGADIKYRELTMDEADQFNIRLMGEERGIGQERSFNMKDATEIAYEKIALCLIEPAMSIDDLKALPASASAAINEISKLIEGQVDEMSDKEGNYED